MTKIGPLLAILSGIIAVTLGIILLLNAKDIISIDFLGDYMNTKGLENSSKMASIGYGISIGIGFFMALLGFLSWGKPRGISSFLLLVLFGANVGLTVWGGLQANSWPIVTIILLVIYGLATLGLVIGMVRGNQAKSA